MKFFVRILSRFSICMTAVTILSCVEIESDFGKLKMPGDLLVTSSTSINKILWHQSNIYYVAYTNSGNSLLSKDILTKETKVVVSSVPPHLVSWINGNFFYVVSLERGVDLIRYNLTVKTGGEELATNLESVIHQKDLVAFNSSGEYDPQAGGSPMYLRDEGTGQQEKIGIGFPLAISPDEQTVLFRTVKDQTFTYHFYHRVTKETNKADFNLLSSGYYYQFYWRTDGLFAIINGDGTIINLSNPTQPGSLKGDFFFVSPFASKVFVISSKCNGQSCNQTWSITSLQLAKPIELITGRNLYIDQVAFSPDENSIAYLFDNKIYTLKIQ